MTAQFDTTAATARTSDKTPAKYYLNIYAGRNQLGYIVLDDHPAIVKFLQENPDDGTDRMLANLRLVFREAGSRTVSYDVGSW